MSVSRSQIGISIATVTLSLQSMNRCSVSWRSLLLPTAGMMSAAVCVAAFCLRFTMMRETSAHAGVACDARALGSSSRRKRSCGHVVGMLSKKIGDGREVSVAARLSSSDPARRNSSFGRWKA